MDAAFPGLLLLAAMLGGVSVLLGRLIAADRLPRNRLAGIRTPATLRSDAAWRAGHRAAGGVLLPTGTAALVGAAIGLVVRVADQPSAGVAVAAAGAAIGLLGILVATARAVRAARQVP